MSALSVQHDVSRPCERSTETWFVRDEWSMSHRWSSMSLLHYTVHPKFIPKLNLHRIVDSLVTSSTSRLLKSEWIAIWKPCHPRRSPRSLSAHGDGRPRWRPWRPWRPRWWRCGGGGQQSKQVTWKRCIWKDGILPAPSKGSPGWNALHYLWISIGRFRFMIIV